MGSLKYPPIKPPDGFHITDEEIQTEILRRLRLKVNREVAMDENLEHDLGLDSLAQLEIAIELTDAIHVDFIRLGLSCNVRDYILFAQAVLNHPNDIAPREEASKPHRMATLLLLGIAGLAALIFFYILPWLAGAK